MTGNELRTLGPKKDIWSNYKSPRKDVCSALHLGYRIAINFLQETLKIISPSQQLNNFNFNQILREKLFDRMGYESPILIHKIAII